MSSHIPGRKEEKFVQIRKDESLGPQSLFTLSETLNLYLTNQKDFFFLTQVLCSKILLDP